MPFEFIYEPIPDAIKELEQHANEREDWILDQKKAGTPSENLQVAQHNLDRLRDLVTQYYANRIPKHVQVTGKDDIEAVKKTFSL